MNLPPPRPVVWWARTNVLDACEPGLLKQFSLSPKDKDRHCRLVRTSQQESFFLSRLLLAMLVRNQLGAGIEVVHTVNSAPRLVVRKPDTELRELAASLSHCDTLVAVALGGNYRCGVDVENVRQLRDLDMLSERVFDESSYRASAELGPGEQCAFFFKIWTAKESYLKARGLGLSIDPIEVEMHHHGHNLWLPRMAHDQTNGSTDGWKTWVLDLPPGHVGALTIERGSDVNPSFDSREVVVNDIRSFLTVL